MYVNPIIYPSKLVPVHHLVAGDGPDDHAASRVATDSVVLACVHGGRFGARRDTGEIAGLRDLYDRFRDFYEGFCVCLVRCV